MRPEDVPGLIPQSTGDRLRDLARAVPADQIIVEIGAYKGRSTCFLADGSSQGNGARIITIDPWDTGILTGPLRRGVSYLATANEGYHARHLAECGVAHRVTAVKGFSQQVPLPTDRVGLLWVDGAHDYPAVTADIARFTPLVVIGGHVVFDDYRKKSPGVDRAVDEFIREQGHRWSWDTSQWPLAVGTRR